MSASKILRDLGAIRQIAKKKKRFCRYCLQCFSSERVLAEHNKVCLKVNGKQNLKLRNVSIKFINYFKQSPVPFKI